MQEGTSIPTTKTLTLDSSFEFAVKFDGNQIWKLKDGMTLDVEISSQYDGILEFSVPAIKIDGYVDQREENPETLETALKSQLATDIVLYALEQDDKLAPRAIELKRKLLDMFEKKEML